MALEFAVDVRNAILAAIPTTIGASAIVRIYTGTMPANVTVASSGTLLAEASLPSTYWGTPSGGTMEKAGTWEDTAANGTGDAGYFRMYASDGTTVKMQGLVSASGGGGDMIVDNVSFATGQPFEILSATLTAPNGPA